MPTFIDYNYDQMKMLAVSYDKQILPGTFELSLMYLIDEKLDLTVFHRRYKNDDMANACIKLGDITELPRESRTPDYAALRCSNCFGVG